MVTYAREPVQVYLREDQLQILEALAQQQHTSVADLVRQGVDVFVTSLPAIPKIANSNLPMADKDPLRGIIGMFSSDTGNLGTDHDRYLVEFEEEDNRPWLRKSS
ncbi:MAG: hypothetical protein M3Z04_20160 [Chloroflexota bacterium]|nr:hypothetical protein [Chloroflexota bacterium]